MRDTAVARASDDFYPRDPTSSHPHLAACAYNTLFLSAILHVRILLCLGTLFYPTPACIAVKDMAANYGYSAVSDRSLPLHGADPQVRGTGHLFCLLD